MSQKLKNILTIAATKLTGGRPMTYLAYAMTDEVSSATINYYEDKLGRIWMAQGPWSWSRVACNYNKDEILMLDELFEDTWKDPLK